MRPIPQRLLGEVPFVWDYSAQSADVSGLPERLPFTVGDDPASGALKQVADERIRDALRKAYTFGSVIAGVDTPASDLTASYSEAFWNFVRGALGQALKGRRCLEIGSGHGAILSRLRDAGAQVVGIEPGQHGQEFARRSGIRVVRDFFPSSQVEGRFDVILACHVLEHIEDASEFLAAIRRSLTPDGRFFCAVPDCTPYIAAGDASMFVHEHFYYHTRATVERMLRAAGMNEIETSPASYGGSLYACCRPGGGDAPVERSGSDSPLETFFRGFDRAAGRISELLQKPLERGEDVGFYMPIRALNLLSLGAMPAERIRFFDDDPGLHGKRLVGYPIQVESRQQLLAAPPRRLMIMSHTFGDRLRAQLSPLLPTETTLLTWSDIWQTSDREGSG